MTDVRVPRANAAAALRGIVAYPITPFRDGEVDLVAMRALVDRLVGGGAHAIAPLGSTGESAYLDDGEWDRVAEAAIGAVDRRVPTVVGISDLTTTGAVRRGRAAVRYGADAVMALPTAYWKLSERELVAHFGAIAEVVDVPVMVYNNPATSGVDMRPEFLVELVDKFDQLTMIKESTGDITRMQRIRHLTRGEVPFFNGSNPLALQAFAAGAAGWCTAAPCLIPEHCLALFQLAENDDFAGARELFSTMLPVLEFILAGGLPTTVKAGLGLLGLDVGVPRRPLLPLDEERTDVLRGLLKDAKDGYQEVAAGRSAR